MSRVGRIDRFGLASVVGLFPEATPPLPAALAPARPPLSCPQQRGGARVATGVPSGGFRHLPTSPVPETGGVAARCLAEPFRPSPARIGSRMGDRRGNDGDG